MAESGLSLVGLGGGSTPCCGAQVLGALVHRPQES